MVKVTLHEGRDFVSLRRGALNSIWCYIYSVKLLVIKLLLNIDYGKINILTELFLKDVEIARELAKEIEFLKSYIITSTYNTRLQIHLNDQFMQNSDRGDMNSELRYTSFYDMNILFQRKFKLRMLLNISFYPSIQTRSSQRTREILHRTTI